MSTFNRLVGLAAKALDTSGKTASPSSHPERSGASGDWRSLVRKAADTLTGDARPSPVRSGSAGSSTSTSSSVSDADRAAVARYDYLLQTADPHQIERIHQEAFARLTPAQRAQVEATMRAELPVHEQPRSAAPDDLARSAARSEAMQPGRLRGLLGRAGGTTALVGAGAAAGGVLALVAGGAMMSAVAAPLLADAASLGVDFDAMAAGVDLESLAGDAVGSAGEGVSQVGEQVSGLGQTVSDLGIPGLGDFFGR